MNFEKKVREGESGSEAAFGCRRRVMAVVDGGAPAKQAMMWALTHVSNKGDILTLLRVIPHSDHSPSSSSSSSKKEERARLLVSSLASLCKACRPEVEVEALVIRGHKLATVLSQVKKLEISVLVLSQTKPSLLSCLMMSRKENFVEQCIEKAECLAMAVSKQSNGIGGYLVSTRCQRNFWLLA
ncbi:uncharacterized protein LOC110113853 [Dendrobium catenatum]|uniref:UspA domain-containing protein n=1 Tax=Dendrobium catenatum TaxID=906689 RepID=A0A2I0VUK6_9ASPA|nr:uncharacterized protein LOC110113853 [Dendrobium catenatum]PKU67083.1 hypothetical protein MA16_Dca008872 [Dendrobium catenatum]